MGCARVDGTRAGVRGWASPHEEVRAWVILMEKEVGALAPFELTRPGFTRVVHLSWPGSPLRPGRMPRRAARQPPSRLFAPAALWSHARAERARAAQAKR
jgi:hypothetical protein